MKISKIIRYLSASLAGILFFCTLSFPRAYGTPKLYLLIVVLTLLLINNLINGATIKTQRPLRYFLIYSAINSLALLVGVLRGNPDQAIIDGLRIGVIFPIIIGLLWTFLLDFKSDDLIHRIICTSSIYISLIIFTATFQHISDIAILSNSFLEDNFLRIGLHDGYLQILSHNIGSMFFILGYLLYFTASQDDAKNHKLSTISLIFGIITAIMSGRRALQIALLLTPVFFIITSKILSKSQSMNPNGFKILSKILLSLFPIGLFLLANEYFYIDNIIERFSGVFKDDGGARTSQAGSLFSGFLSNPFFGSGVGGTTDVIRSEDSPWVYELTYNQILFNFGLIGSTFLILVFAIELIKIKAKSSRRSIEYSIHHKSLFNGLLFLMFGAATNPYLGSFDFLLLLGIIPFLASSGFTKSSFK